MFAVEAIIYVPIPQSGQGTAGGVLSAAINPLFRLSSTITDILGQPEFLKW